MRPCQHLHAVVAESAACQVHAESPSKCDPRISTGRTRRAPNNVTPRSGALPPQGGSVRQERLGRHDGVLNEPATEFGPVYGTGERPKPCRTVFRFESGSALIIAHFTPPRHIEAG